MRTDRILMLGATALLLCGCDLGGTYEKRATEALSTVGEKAAREALLAPSATTVAPSTLALRLPASIDNEGKTALKPADPSFNPPFVAIPGLAASLERLLDDEGGKFAAAYVYLGAAAKEGKKAVDVQADVQKEVATAFPAANWQDVQIGQALAAKHLSASGPQDFQTSDAQGTRSVAKLEGQFDLYFHESPTHFVFIGFRAPKGQATKYTLSEAIKASLSTIEAGSSEAGSSRE
ncbi:MAG: hypothetical protein L0211_20085 [Planctomycetaceae bacterium]|nr:hypothetical protein [Planctomycetaceae bacterium]